MFISFFCLISSLTFSAQLDQKVDSKTITKEKLKKVLAGPASPGSSAASPSSSSEESFNYPLPTPQIMEVEPSQGGTVEVRDEDGSAKIIPKIEMVVDSSGSMGQVLGENKTKMFFLKKITARYFTDQWKEEAKTAMRVYGSREKGNCEDNHLTIGFGERVLSRIETAVGKMEPVGMTPLFKSVKMASDDLKSYEGPKRIVVFTDGEDTCGGDPCKIAAEIKSNPNLDLKIYVVAIGFKPDDPNFKKVSCLGDTQVAESEQDMVEALGNISQNINRDRLNLRVISPDPSAVVHLSHLENGVPKYYRSFTAAWGATVPPGTYQAVVQLNPVYKFANFTIPPGKVVTLKVGGDGRVRVNFVNSILNVEILDKNRTPIRKFKSDKDQMVPTGRWTLRMYQEPFYEKIVKKFDVYPNGNHEYTVVGAGAIQVESTSLRGVYLYDGKKNLLGHYLTQFPMVVPSLDYMVHVDNECSFEGVPIADRQIKILECRSEK